MAQKMLDKWEKYYDVINDIMGDACVLDPRYKLNMLECCYTTIYDFDASDKVDSVKDTCYALFHEYQQNLSKQVKIMIQFLVFLVIPHMYLISLLKVVDAVKRGVW